MKEEICKACGKKLKSLNGLKCHLSAQIWKNIEHIRLAEKIGYPLSQELLNKLTPPLTLKDITREY